MQGRKGGAWRIFTSGQAYINGAWRQLINGESFTNNRWRDVCNFTSAPTSPNPPPPTGTMTLAVSATSIFGESSAVPITTSFVTATPSGGASPYKYVWSIVSSDGQSYTLTAPNGATTAATIAALTGGSLANCSISCVATDSTGLTATSASVTARFFRDFSGPGFQP